MTNPYSGDPAAADPSLSVDAGDTESDVPSDAPESPQAVPDINPDVVAHSTPGSPGDVDSGDVAEPPAKLTLEERVAALEARVYGYHLSDHNPDADSDSDND